MSVIVYLDHDAGDEEGLWLLEEERRRSDPLSHPHLRFYRSESRKYLGGLGPGPSRLPESWEVEVASGLWIPFEGGGLTSDYESVCVYSGAVAELWLLLVDSIEEG
jgi:hypothetical protein